MADQLPQITGSRAVNSTVTPTTSLIGRGLSAVIQNKEIAIAKPELDARYRKARDVYDQITSYGEERRFNYEGMPKRGKQFDVFEDNPLQPYFDLLHQLADTFKVFQELADQGFGRAYFPLARMYWGGQGINQNIDKYEYYSRLSFSYCSAYQTLNEPEIWRDLGWMYANGHGVEQDYALAVYWYGKAAEECYAEAQLKLGRMYDGGRGVVQDYAQAIFWYRKAAEQGNAEAQHYLGFGYEYSVKQDYEQAVYWYGKAAVRGHVIAQLILGSMYEEGRGVVKDNGLAVFWFSTAAKQGDVVAQRNLGEFYFSESM